MMKRYQIFISSTYIDLIEERSAVVEAILKLKHIPVGMELFVAAENEQFDYIKQVIDESDYFVLIVGNRYGSIAADGISYTEKEFNYAAEKQIPILAFIHNNPNTISSDISKNNQEQKEQLDNFRKKVMTNRLVSYFSWGTPDKLSNEVLIALINTFNSNPRRGWERPSSFDNTNLLDQLNSIRIENDELKRQIEKQNEDEIKKNKMLMMQTNFTFDREAIISLKNASNDIFFCGPTLFTLCSSSSVIKNLDDNVMLRLLSMDRKDEELFNQFCKMRYLNFNEAAKSFKFYIDRYDETFASTFKDKKNIQERIVNRIIPCVIFAIDILKPNKSSFIKIDYYVIDSRSDEMNIPVVAEYGTELFDTMKMQIETLWSEAYRIEK